MQKEIKRFECNARMSRVVQCGGLVFIGGQTADDETTDIREQTAQVLSKIDKYLGMVGIGRMQILSAQVWLADIAADYDAMNEVWDGWVPEGHAPARATVQASLALPTLRVEIAVIAAK